MQTDQTDEINKQACDNNSLLHSPCNKITDSSCKNKPHRGKKEKKWNCWSREEKLLFYEAIANGTNGALSLQKLFKSMNEKIGTKSTEKIRDYYYRAHKQVTCLLKNCGDLQINLKDKKEALCALKCFGKVLMNDTKISSKTESLKSLNKHPRLLKQISNTLNKMLSTKLKSIRNNKKQKQIFTVENKIKDKADKNYKENDNKSVKSNTSAELNLDKALIANEISHKTYEKIYTHIKNVQIEKRTLYHERLLVRILPYDSVTYSYVIAKKLNPRLEILVPSSKSMISIVEFLTTKYLRNDHTSKIIKIIPLMELWNCDKEGNNNNNNIQHNENSISINTNFSNINFYFSFGEGSRYYDVGDVWIGYGRPNTNLIYLYYQIAEKFINESNTVSLIANPTVKDESAEYSNKSITNNFINDFNNQNDDDGFDFDPLDFLGLYEDDKKDSSSEDNEESNHKHIQLHKDLQEPTPNKGNSEINFSSYNKSMSKKNFKITQADQFSFKRANLNFTNCNNNINNNTNLSNTSNKGQKRIPFNKYESSDVKERSTMIPLSQSFGSFNNIKGCIASHNGNANSKFNGLQSIQNLNLQNNNISNFNSQPLKSNLGFPTGFNQLNQENTTEKEVKTRRKKEKKTELSPLSIMQNKELTPVKNHFLTSTFIEDSYFYNNYNNTNITSFDLMKNMNMNGHNSNLFSTNDAVFRAADFNNNSMNLNSYNLYNTSLSNDSGYNKGFKKN